MSRSSALPTQVDPVIEQFPDHRTLLEEHWRRQVATITELSYAALTPASGEHDGPSATRRLQVAARLIAAARRQLHETEAALAEIRDAGHAVCGACGAPVTGTPGDRAPGRALRPVQGSAYVATPPGEERR
jgi:RNA polymerase-binding transcription factor DksA